MSSIKTVFKNRHFRFLIKFTFVAALLFVLWKKGLLSIEETRKALMQIEFILPAFVALAIATNLSLLRWYLLLRAQEIPLSLGRTFELGYVGLFFNIALPGAVSGDLVKALYIGREVPGKRAPAFGSILFDRVAGSSALILVSLAALIMSMGASWSGPLMRSIELIVIMAGSGVLLFYVYLFLVKEKVDPLLYFFKKGEGRVKAFGSVRRIYLGVKDYHQHRGVVLKTLFISFIIHCLTTFSCVCIAQALNQSVPTLAIFIIVPLALLVTAIPIMPGGVGTGHAAFLALFALLGTQRGADIFSVYVLYQFLVGGIGGLVYLRFKSTHKIESLEALKGLDHGLDAPASENGSA